LLSWSELAQMATAGFEMGAHSVTHRPLTEMAPGEAEREIVESKTTIEERLGRKVSAFAYPFGVFSRANYEVVREHFRGACSVKLGKARRADDRHQLPRVDVYYLRHPALFQLFETLPGQAYLGLRGAGRNVRAGLVRCGLLSENKLGGKRSDG
jgi:peptidoglycan/xylan/chitin deacetylase (PgdA/CDA1 family)